MLGRGGIVPSRCRAGPGPLRGGIRKGSQEGKISLGNMGNLGKREPGPFSHLPPLPSCQPLAKGYPIAQEGEQILWGAN